MTDSTIWLLSILVVQAFACSWLAFRALARQRYDRDVISGFLLLLTIPTMLSIWLGLALVIGFVGWWTPWMTIGFVVAAAANVATTVAEVSGSKSKLVKLSSYVIDVFVFVVFITAGFWWYPLCAFGVMIAIQIPTLVRAALAKKAGLSL